jgi:ABC-type sugar transport system ATPase subunit
MAEVKIEHITKVFGGTVRAVDDVSFVIEDRSVVCILGPSGCGKTTLLRMIAGLEEPTSGRIYFDGRDITDLDVRERDVAMVFQFPAVYPHLDVWHNIAFPLIGQKMERKLIDKKVREVAEILGLTDSLYERPHALDTGMKQKISICRAVVRDPMVFLFDEPLSNVDPNLRVDLKSTIKTLSKELGQTFVYVTHDQSEAMTLADRIAIMKDGKLLQYDTPDEVYDNPVNPFVGWFLGNPGMNFVRAVVQVADGGTRVRVNGTEYQANIPSDRTGEVLLAIRPEFIRISSQRQGPNWIEGICNLVEPMGGRNIVHVGMGDLFIRVKTPADQTFSIGDTVYVHFPDNYVRLFDANEATA